MKSTKRALRRHHRERMIRKAMRSLVLSSEEDPEVRRQRAVGWYDNLARCSCWMCGNPRKHWRLIPMQEQRQLLAARDEEGPEVGVGVRASVRRARE